MSKKVKQFNNNQYSDNSFNNKPNIIKKVEKLPLLSVIVPVYNTANYLHRCIESILSQTYKNLEVIFVNDASPDDSKSIINKFLQNDPRVKLVEHEKNRGLFQARISGVRAAKGDYIAFVDSDDYISIDYYRLLIKKALETDSDIVIADWVYQYEDGKKEYLNLDNIRMQDLCLENDKVLEAFMKQRGTCFSWSVVWNKIYKKSLWNKCYPYFNEFAQKHEPLIMCEDIAYSCVFWSFAQKVTNVHNIQYYYFKHSNQATAEFKDYDKYLKCLNDVIFVFEFFEYILDKNKIDYSADFNAWKDFFCRTYYKNCLGKYFESKATKYLKEKFNKNSLEKPFTNDGFFYSLATGVSESVIWLENLKRDISSPDTDIVSFDVFDTLILRPFFSPSDIFYLMNDYFAELTDSSSYINFAQIRIESERICRERARLLHPGNDDITIDNIYEVMDISYLIPKNILNKLKEKEIQLETEFCYERKIGKELYDLAHYCGKKIILISDMYLNSDSINSILLKNGYNKHQELYLSSELKLGKWSGRLFKYVMSKEGKKRIVHIGDNWKSDVEKAKENGFIAHHLCQPLDIFKGLNPGIFSGKSFNNIFNKNSGQIDLLGGINQFLGLRSMLAVVANKLFDNPFVSFNKQSDFNANPKYIGYYNVGMHLYSLIDWIIHEIDPKTTNTLHFVARDGFIPKKAYDILSKFYPFAPKSNYIYLSRKALALLDVEKNIDLYSLINKVNIFNLTPNKIYKMTSFALKDDLENNFLYWCKKNYYLPDAKFLSRYEYELFLKLYIENFLDERKLKLNNENIKNYFSKIIFKGDYIFDIGYGGRAEAALSHLLGFPVNSYYIHSNSHILAKRQQRFGFNNKSFYNYKPEITGVMREHVFMELGPSTLGYKNINNKVEPIFEDYNSDYQTELITTIVQDSAIEFVKDFTSIFHKYLKDMVYRYVDASQPFEYYLHYSKNFDRQIFSSIVFEDDCGEGKSLNAVEFWNNEIERCKLNNFNREVQVEYIAKKDNKLNDLYEDGLFVKLYTKINKKYPKGSKKRERIKKIVSKFIK